MNSLDSLTNYKSIRELLQAFRQSSTHSDALTSDINWADSPGRFYFRLLFDFSTPSGLLYKPKGTILSEMKGKDVSDWQGNKDSSLHYSNNSALQYLLVNGEWERAEMLNNFINLLSNINSRSPWYFQAIEGLGEAVTASIGNMTEDDYKIEDTRIAIKCLPDAFDTRIGTLLDLYRNIVFSKQNRTVILPENLRKFNMSIYIFHVPIHGLYAATRKDSHLYAPGEAKPTGIYDEGSDSAANEKLYADFSQNSSGTYRASSKLFELKGCEIEVNSSATGYSEITNEDGFQLNYGIGIRFKQIIEQRYNEILNRAIGDILLSDLLDPQNGFKIDPYNNEDIYQLSEVSSIIGEQDPRLPYKDSEKNNKISDVFEYSNQDSVQYESQHIPEREKDLLGKSMLVDIHLPSQLDPFSKMIDSKLKIVNNSLTNVTNSANKVLNSYSVSGLTNLGSQFLGGLVDKYVLGNTFRNAINTGIKTIEGFTASSVLDKALNNTGIGSNGWGRTKPSSTLGKNIFKL